jgi:predicted hydrocarbon binding protein
MSVEKTDDVLGSLTPSLLRQEDDGILRESITNARVIMFSCAAYRSMCDSLFEQFQSGSGIILYRMGQGYARKLTEGISKLELSREEAVKVYQKLSYMAGWGNVKIMVEDEKSGICTVHKSAFVLRRKDVGATSCFFFSGALSTIASSIVGRDFTAREVHCETGGYDYCRFAIQQSETQ